jgi:CelD/BcsL family acetyltransferase involved in cellulose biosynthesis
VLLTHEMSAIADLDPLGSGKAVDMRVWTGAHEIARLAPRWQELCRSGLASPYQSPAWVEAYAGTIAPAHGETIRIVTLAAPDGTLELVLPLAVTRRTGLQVASIVGGRHANFHMPAMSRALARRIDGAGAADLLRRVALAMGGIDLFELSLQPKHWGGTINPFALLTPHPSASNAYGLALQASGEQTLRRVLSGETRKKLRRKREKLAADFGPVTLVDASDTQQRKAILSAFLAQKDQRFRDMGIANPFSCSGVAAFMDAAARGTGGPVAFYALKAGERIVATFGGACDSRRLSGMVNSFDATPAVARHSPGDLLLVDVIARQCELGRENLDLGVGEARYKTMFCDEVEELVDCFVPVTWSGRALAIGGRVAGDLKRYVKQNPFLFQAARQVRSARHSLSL